MNALTELPSLTGHEQLRAIFAGKTAHQGIVKTLGLPPASADEIVVVFAENPDRSAYNPIGSVHGSYAATLLDTAMGCAVPSRMKPGQGYTALELKVDYYRAMRDTSGPICAEGRVTAFAEGKLFDKSGSLCATTTCLVHEL